jgi:hypothetical protein
MSRLSLVLLCLVSILLLPASAHAAICAADDVPAATLLLPYFEVDLDDPNGSNTLFTINNASATAVLAHVVVWSDLSVPVLDFNVYLTGYDVQSVNLRDLVVNGLLPRTAPAGQDAGEAEPNPAPTPGAVSNQGAFSQDLDFPSCAGQLPLPPLPPVFTAHLQNALTGQFSNVLGACAGLDYDDRFARGYVTVDAVNNCTLRFPGDAGYFVAGGAGDATNQNVLWGDYFYVNPGQNFAQGESLVHIEADAANPETSVPGEYTFYGRYVAWTAADNREPLPTNFIVRFVSGGAFTGGTELTVWRDSKVAQGAFKCGTLPTWFGLGQEQIVVFDEEENLVEEVPPVVSPRPVPNESLPFFSEARKVNMDSDEFFDLPLEFGWIYLNLNTTVAAAGSNPPEDPSAAQAWVSTLMSAEGRFSVGFDAIHLDSACDASHILISD